jgi:hypothetical protein
MSFIWQGQDILLQGDTPVKLQMIGFEQFNSLINNPNKLVEVNLCSLRVIEDSDHFISSMTTTLQPSLGNNSTIDELLHSYQDILRSQHDFLLLEHMTMLFLSRKDHNQSTSGLILTLAYKRI